MTNLSFWTGFLMVFIPIMFFTGTLFYNAFIRGNDIAKDIIHVVGITFAITAYIILAIYLMFGKLPHG